MLFYVQTSELEGGSGEARCPQTEHKVAASTSRGSETAPSFTGPGSEEPAQEAPIKHTSLQQWRLLQEQSRPKPQFNLREVEPCPARRSRCHSPVLEQRGQDRPPAQPSSRGRPPLGGQGHWPRSWSQRETQGEQEEEEEGAQVRARMPVISAAGEGQGPAGEPWAGHWAGVGRVCARTWTLQ